MSTPGAVWAGQYGPQVVKNSDAVRDRFVREEIARTERQGIIHAATVINLHTFPLTVNLAYLGTVTVPGREIGQRYAKLRIDRPRIDLADAGGANFIPRMVLPRELGAEVVREYSDIGGVLSYEGDGEPPEHELTAAQERQLAWFRSEYRKASDAWGRYHQHKMITDRQRDAARALFIEREIAELPEWVSYVTDATESKECVSCGERVKAKANVCRYCGAPFISGRHEGTRST